MCKHPKSKRTYGPDRCFSRPAYGTTNPKPAAHGGITYYEKCPCGARRQINVNGRFCETGAWFTPEPE